MNTFMFDFSNGKVITNPLEGITHFYISSYNQLDVWDYFKLANKVEGINLDIVFESGNNLPVIVMPFSILNLGKCIIKLHDDMSGGKICTGRKSVYFTFSKQSHIICITGVH